MSGEILVTEASGAGGEALATVVVDCAGAGCFFWAVVAGRLCCVEGFFLGAGGGAVWAVVVAAVVVVVGSVVEGLGEVGVGFVVVVGEVGC